MDPATPPPSRPLLRAILRPLAWSNPFAAFTGLMALWLREDISTQVAVIGYIFLVTFAGTIDGIVASSASTDDSTRKLGVAGHALAFALLLSVLAPVIVTTIFFASCTISVSRNH